MSADGADWIHEIVREKAPQALICLYACDVIRWAGEGARRELVATGETVRKRTAQDLSWATILGPRLRWGADLRVLVLGEQICALILPELGHDLIVAGVAAR